MASNNNNDVNDNGIDLNDSDDDDDSIDYTEVENAKPIPRGLAKDTMREIIKARLYAVSDDDSLIESKPWANSSPFYRSRKRLAKLGYNVNPMNDPDTRKAMTKWTKELCDEMGKKRHELGIFSSPRSNMVYAGQMYTVDFDSLKGLASMPTDIIVVEN